MKIKIKSVQGVCEWKWKLDGNLYSSEDDRICGICNFNFDLACPNCEAPGVNCGLLEGKCGHVFHHHCIDKWLTSDVGKGKCPLDRIEWENATQ
ncbi:anaphase-promoting complex subunit Apc11 [Conidiobolus coronatus NRRL 28638]|jgi:anaphase-promoting complex subunit 11|uniref:Anaphase-promoting complex subunit 11 n=1 Tax=Conidiobolus coronatus (strain ATCC 28846 / CBS 209.66 / NRRL 28638) TaxID=796925 RepID=A0A137PA90_CONC2|nr:anaphase-promoting complex subunit Apc11 [Conidiobolus coronatus NRRL 28638]|eukprot:KXN71841.1 anaphase-promoting complex subunit Apc11 [Conidiobolus coronatus NRRL 28638]